MAPRERACEPAVLVAVDDAGARDRRLTFLTRGRGAVYVYAKRTQRRGTSPSAWLGPLQAGELCYTRTSEGGPGRFFSFLPQRIWPGIRRDFGRTVHAVAFLELVNIALTEGEAQAPLFELLVGFLNRLEDEYQPEAARVVATLHLLAISGFSPELEQCTGCRSAVKPGSVLLFSPAEGGAICSACASGQGGGCFRMSRAAHAFMVRALSRRDGKRVRLGAHPTVTSEVARLLTPFIEHRTGMRLRSAGFFEKLASSSLPGRRGR